MICIDLSADKADTVSKAKNRVSRCETQTRSTHPEISFQGVEFRGVIEGNYLYFLVFQFQLHRSFKFLSHCVRIFLTAKCDVIKISRKSITSAAPRNSEGREGLLMFETINDYSTRKIWFGLPGNIKRVEKCFLPLFGRVDCCLFNPHLLLGHLRTFLCDLFLFPSPCDSPESGLLTTVSRP